MPTGPRELRGVRLRVDMLERDLSVRVGFLNLGFISNPLGHGESVSQLKPLCRKND